MPSRSYRGECGRLVTMLINQREAAVIAAGEFVILAVVASTPDWANSMDDVPNWKSVSNRDFRISLVASLESGALLLQFRPGGSQDGSAHSVIAQQEMTGRIHNDISMNLCDVSMNDFQSS